MMERKYNISRLLKRQDIYNETKRSYVKLKAFAFLINWNALPSNYLQLYLKK